MTATLAPDTPGVPPASRRPRRARLAVMAALILAVVLVAVLTLGGGSHRAKVRTAPGPNPYPTFPQWVDYAVSEARTGSPRATGDWQYFLVGVCGPNLERCTGPGPLGRTDNPLGRLVSDLSSGPTAASAEALCRDAHDADPGEPALNCTA